jgi:hypothetical protein
MKRITILAALGVMLATGASSQQWLGSSTSTNTVYRDGNVIVGGTTQIGSIGNPGRVLEIQSTAESYFSLRKIGAPSLQLTFGMSSTNGAGFYSTGGIPMFFSTEFAERMRIMSTGQIGIGTRLTTNPNGYLLAVKGKIGAYEIQVENTSTTWADYVFEPSYALRPLPVLEKFIRQNKHLPEIPSAEEVKTNGHKLGEMDVLLLKKVEELTLYVIELNKKLEAQEKLIKEQKEKLEALEGR